MTGLLVLLCLLPSILGSTIRASSYDASNYLSDFEVYKESYAIPSAMNPSIKNYRQLIFVRNMQKIQASNSKLSDQSGSFLMKSNRYTMFRYDEFEASVAFTRETQNPQIDAYTIAGIDASPDIINQILEDIGTDEIDINRGLRCFREPDTDQTRCEQKARYFKANTLSWRYQYTPFSPCEYKITELSRKKKSKIGLIYQPLCHYQNSIQRCFDRMSYMSDNQPYYHSTCVDDSQLHFYGHSSYPDVMKSNSLSPNLFSLDAYGMDSKGREVPLSEQQIIDCTPLNHQNSTIQFRIGQTLDYMMTDGLSTDEDYPSTQRNKGECQIKGGRYRLSKYSILDNCDAIHQFLQSGRVTRFAPDLNSDLVLSANHYGSESVITAEQFISKKALMDNKAAPSAYRVLAPIRLDPAWQFYAGGVLPSQPVGVGFNYVVTLIGSNQHYWTAKGSLEIGDGNAKEIYIRKGPTHRRAFTSKIGNQNIGDTFYEDGVCQLAYAVY